MAEFAPNIFVPIEPDAARADKTNQDEQVQVESENPPEKSKKRQGITARIEEAADPSSRQ